MRSCVPRARLHACRTITEAWSPANYVSPVYAPPLSPPPAASPLVIPSAHPCERLVRFTVAIRLFSLSLSPLYAAIKGFEDTGCRRVSAAAKSGFFCAPLGHTRDFLSLNIMDYRWDYGAKYRVLRCLFLSLSLALFTLIFDGETVGCIRR